jgi:2-polyprenyl-3-methyl-5-hydroxy-6-metoxy-1,4-benzoquinol methylase
VRARGIALQSRTAVASVGIMTEPFPELAGTAWGRLVAAVLTGYPEHADFVAKSFASCSPAVKQTAFRTAESIERLVEGRLDGALAGYRWMCGMVLEEELHFRRNGTYRYSRFDDANREVYANAPLMDKYMSGLLLSQILWSNHLEVFDFYVRDFVAHLDAGGRHLEVGPGHGLFLFQAAQGQVKEVVGWDVSRTSLDRTAGCLRELGVVCPVILEERNVFEPLALGDRARFDSIVISEVLEHVERPGDALATLHTCLAPAGRIFVNAPVNSPALDHIYLFKDPEDLVELVREAGFTVEATRFAPVTGRTEAKARKMRLPISVAVVARA